MATYGLWDPPSRPLDVEPWQIDLVANELEKLKPGTTAKIGRDQIREAIASQHLSFPNGSLTRDELSRVLQRLVQNAQKAQAQATMRSAAGASAVGGLRSLSPAAPGSSNIDPNVFGIPSTASFVSAPLTSVTTSLSALSLTGAGSNAFSSSPTTSSSLHHHSLLMHQPQPQHSVLQAHALNGHHVAQQQQQQQQQIYNHLAANGMNGLQSAYHGHPGAGLVNVNDIIGEGSDAIYRWKSECVHFARSGYCKRGNSCHFRHGAADGRSKPEGWRPQPHHHGAGPVPNGVMQQQGMHSGGPSMHHNGYVQQSAQQQAQQMQQQHSQSLYSMHSTQPSPPPTALAAYGMQQTQPLDMKPPTADPWSMQSLDSSPLITPSVSPSLSHRSFAQQPSPPPQMQQQQPQQQMLPPMSASPVPSSTILMQSAGQQTQSAPLAPQPQQQLLPQQPQQLVSQSQPAVMSAPPSASSTPPVPSPMPPQTQTPPSPQSQQSQPLQPTPVLPMTSSSPQPQEQPQAQQSSPGPQQEQQTNSSSAPSSPIVPPLASVSSLNNAANNAGAPLSPTSAATTPNSASAENLPKDFGHVCRYFEMGYCKYSDRCNFAHQLRNPDIPPNTSWDTDEVVRFYSSLRRAVDILKETAAGLPARVREYALDGLELCMTPSADNRRNAAIKFHDLLTAALDIAVTRNNVHLPQNAKVGDKLEAVRRQLHLPTPEYDAMDRIRVLGNACQHVQGYRVALHHLSKLINALGVVFSWVTREASAPQ